MGIEKNETPDTNELDKTSFAKKPIVDQLTDIAARAAGQLAEAAVKSVANRAKKAVAKKRTVKKAAAAKVVKATKAAKAPSAAAPGWRSGATTSTSWRTSGRRRSTGSAPT